MNVFHIVKQMKYQIIYATNIIYYNNATNETEFKKQDEILKNIRIEIKNALNTTDQRRECYLYNNLDKNSTKFKKYSI